MPARRGRDDVAGRGVRIGGAELACTGTGLAGGEIDGGLGYIWGAGDDSSNSDTEVVSESDHCRVRSAP